MEEGPARWPGDHRRTDAPATRDEVVPATWDDVVGRAGRDAFDASAPPAPAWQPQKAAVWEPRYAGWRRRAAAFLIDVVVAWAVPVGALIAYNLSLTPQNGTQSYATPLSATSDLLVVLLLLSTPLALVAYPVWFLGHRGQTPGMKWIRIRLYRTDDEKGFIDPTYKDSWLRCVVTLAFLLFFLWGGFLDYFAPLWDGRNRCWHDNVVHTVVVDERER